MRRSLTALSRRTAVVSVVQLKFAARMVLVVALAATCLAAVVHHRQAFWILANGHQEPHDLFAATPKPMATTGIAGTFTTFEAPDAGTTALEGTGGLAINASGEIAGVYSNQVGVYRGFVRATDGTITEFDAVPYTTLKAGQGTIPVSINSAGDIAGTYIDTNNVNHGFMRAADGTITVFLAGQLATSRSQGTVAMSINDLGQVAGFYLAQDSKGFPGPFDGFVRAADGTITTFSAPDSSASYAAGTQVYSINASGDISGSYVDSSNDRHGFVLTPGGVFTSFDPPGGDHSSSQQGSVTQRISGTLPVAIDANGDVAGAFTDNSAIRHGFFRSASGTIATFDPPGVGTGTSLIQGTLPFSMSPSGNAISGLYSDAAGVYHGFVRNTSGAISTFDVPGAGTAGSSAFPGTNAFAVNDAGNLAGVYTDANGLAHGFLFSPTVAAVATPTFSVAAGTYTSAQTVSISDKTTGATIYYTLDGSTPTNQSPKYSTPLPVNQTTTINAIAEAAGYSNSAVASATYTIAIPVAATPVFSPAVGTYTTAQAVTLTDSTSGASIYYTTNGTTPTASSTLYTGAITVSSTETIEAIAVAPGYTNSPVAIGVYTINLAAPSFTVSVSPTALTVTTGQSGTVAVSVKPQNGFNSAVTFACGGLPAGAACSFSPATVTPSGATVAKTTLTVTTGTTATNQDSRPLVPGATLAFTLCLLGWRKRRSVQLLLVLTVSFAGLSLLSACGGGSSGGSSSPPPPSTSTVTITATSGAVQNTTSLTLTVK